MATRSPETLSPATSEFWDAPFAGRLCRFETLRDNPVPTFHTETEGPGSWSIVHHDAVVEVSRNPDVFSSAQGFTIADFPPAVIEGSMAAMDGPRHRRFRSIVQSAFTNNAVRTIADRTRSEAEATIRLIPADAQFDFVRIASHFPLYVLCELIGIPTADRSLVEHLADDVVGVNASNTFSNSPGGSPSIGALFSYAHDLGERRRAQPTDDVVSRLLAPGKDGSDGLTPAEFSSFLILLITAGYDTTRQALSWALHLLTKNPDQRDLLLGDYERHIDNAIAEIVRWSSPVPYMRRTATRRIDFHGTTIEEGDKVVMWYLSANHDSTVFESPATFDIRRHNATEQLGFGAKDLHHCLGINLARLELRTMLKALFDAYPLIASTGDPELVQSAFVSGVYALPCSVR
ncbi:cytochrome [Rhodococcus sp. CUA-806]|jgi:cytochrome P450|nr:cytochrome [Rhodococcus sp. CUA-806]